MVSADPRNQGDALSVPWIDIVQFVRQLSHDLRNHLNAIELQSAYIGELTADAEIKTEIKRLREALSGLTTILQKLSAGLGQIRTEVMPYGGADFIEDLRKKVVTDFPRESTDISWDVHLRGAALEIDPQLLQQAFIELFNNAFRHERGKGPLTVAAKIDNDRFVFTLREPKSRFELSTENWGREPLRKISPGHYGLGLNLARIIVEAHGGKLRAHYDPTESVLVTTITLPLSAKGS
jgi:signal transduction histidine kinase